MAFIIRRYPNFIFHKVGKDIVCAIRNNGFKRREDRGGRTAGVSVVIPMALLSSYVRER